jgi:hypothetical protein
MKRTNNTPPGPVAEAKEALFRNLLKQRLPMTPDMLTREEIERLKQRAKERSAFLSKGLRAPAAQGEIREIHTPRRLAIVPHPIPLTVRQHAPYLARDPRQSNPETPPRPPVGTWEWNSG